MEKEDHTPAHHDDKQQEKAGDSKKMKPFLCRGLNKSTGGVGRLGSKIDLFESLCHEHDFDFEKDSHHHHHRNDDHHHPRHSQNHSHPYHEENHHHHHEEDHPRSYHHHDHDSPTTELTSLDNPTATTTTIPTTTPSTSATTTTATVAAATATATLSSVSSSSSSSSSSALPHPSSSTSSSSLKRMNIMATAEIQPPPAKTQIAASRTPRNQQPQQQKGVYGIPSLSKEFMNSFQPPIHSKTKIQETIITKAMSNSVLFQGLVVQENQFLKQQKQQQMDSRMPGGNNGDNETSSGSSSSKSLSSKQSRSRVTALIQAMEQIEVQPGTVLVEQGGSSSGGGGSSKRRGRSDVSTPNTTPSSSSYSSSQSPPVSQLPPPPTTTTTSSQKHFYIVESGQVEFQIDGKIIGIAGSGQSFGEEQLLFNAQPGASVVVASSSSSSSSTTTNDHQHQHHQDVTKLFRIDSLTYRGIMQTTATINEMKEEEKLYDPLEDVKEKEKDDYAWLKEHSGIMEHRRAVHTAIQSTIGLDDLEKIAVLGEGQFGEVWLVHANLTVVESFVEKEEEEEEEDVDETLPKKEIYSFALKRQCKHDFERCEDTELYIRREMDMLRELQHPFICEFVHHYDEDTTDSSYMLLGVVTGGELWDLIHNNPLNDDGENGDAEESVSSGLVGGEDQAKFYALILVDTLAYLHSKLYIYRDVKPENVMIDSDGYPVLVDFGFAKPLTHLDGESSKTFTFCGTPNYVAPEIIQNVGHNWSADHWAIGILIYEMVSGENPFYDEGMESMEVFRRICECPYYPFKPEHNRSADVVNLLDGLLAKDPNQRLGSRAKGGWTRDIVTHAWFDGLDLNQLRRKAATAPWVPESSKKKEEKAIPVLEPPQEEVHPVVAEPTASTTEDSKDINDLTDSLHLENNEKSNAIPLSDPPQEEVQPVVAEPSPSATVDMKDIGGLNNSLPSENNEKYNPSVIVATKPHANDIIVEEIPVSKPQHEREATNDQQELQPVVVEPSLSTSNDNKDMNCSTDSLPFENIVSVGKRRSKVRILKNGKEFVPTSKTTSKPRQRSPPRLNLHRHHQSLTKNGGNTETKKDDFTLATTEDAVGSNMKRRSKVRMLKNGQEFVPQPNTPLAEEENAITTGKLEDEKDSKDNLDGSNEDSKILENIETKTRQASPPRAHSKTHHQSSTSSGHVGGNKETKEVDSITTAKEEDERDSKDNLDGNNGDSTILEKPKTKTRQNCPPRAYPQHLRLHHQSSTSSSQKSENTESEEDNAIIAAQEDDEKDSKDNPDGSNAHNEDSRILEKTERKTGQKSRHHEHSHRHHRHHRRLHHQSSTSSSQKSDRTETNEDNAIIAAEEDDEKDSKDNPDGSNAHNEDSKILEKTERKTRQKSRHHTHSHHHHHHQSSKSSSRESDKKDTDNAIMGVKEEDKKDSNDSPDGNNAHNEDSKILEKTKGKTGQKSPPRAHSHHRHHRCHQSSTSLTKVGGSSHHHRLHNHSSTSFRTKVGDIKSKEDSFITSAMEEDREDSKILEIGTGVEEGGDQDGCDCVEVSQDYDGAAKRDEGAEIGEHNKPFEGEDGKWYVVGEDGYYYEVGEDGQYSNCAEDSPYYGCYYYEPFEGEDGKWYVVGEDGYYYEVGEDGQYSNCAEDSPYYGCYYDSGKEAEGEGIAETGNIIRDVLVDEIDSLITRL